MSFLNQWRKLMHISRYLVVAISFAGACTAAEKAPADSTQASKSASADDPDRNVAGGAVPAGYTARTDRADAPISGAKYVASGDTWEVTTGPAHIIYSAKDLGNGSYTASATFEQLEKPTHPEAYGIFIGGRDLDKDSQAYTYFLVRGTGDLAIKARDGAQPRDVIKWTPSADVPKADASGKARYDLAVQVTADAVKFSVNGKQVASVSKAGLPVDGIVGLRINHNLHVRVTPVSVTAP
jgi:hypothetical protein